MEIKHKPSVFYYSNIRSFMTKFLVNGKNQFSLQKYIKPTKKFGYYPQIRNLNQDDFLKHFYYGGRETNSEIAGSLAIRPTVDGRLKFVVFDIDRKHQKEEFIEKACPLLSKYGLDYILEHGGDEFDRCKIWIFMDCTIETARHLIFQIGEETDLNFSNPEDRHTYYDEIFGVNKIDFVVRVPIGYHITRKDVFPIEVEEELTVDPEIFVKQVLLARQPTEEEIKPLLRPLTKVKKVEETKKVRVKNDVFYYKSLNLKLPKDLDVPPGLKPVYKNCQAAHAVLHGIINEDYIEAKGELYHSAGLFTSGMCIYSDIKRSRFLKKNIVNGRDFWKYLVTKYRHRDDTSHNWEAAKRKAESNPDRLFTSCKKWDEKFNLCKGCPWKGQITSPKQFIYGKEIERELVENVRLVTPQGIREHTFPKIKNTIDFALENNSFGNYLIASPQGSGKSYWASLYAAELASRGYRILFAVPTSDLGKEVKQRIEDQGQSAFALRSHKNTFKGKEMDFDCPYYDKIQTLSELGVSSSIYKEQFCKKCPFYDKCHYPRQYKEVQEEEHNIVIIQHAHLQCQEVVFELMKKNFDVLFIDESFIKVVYDSIKVFPWEKSLLELFDMPWVTKLLSWLEGKEPARGKLNPSEKDLRKVNKAFRNKEWRIPQFIRFYNQGRYVDEFVGVEVIYELPGIPIKIFTDATPPVELLKRLIGQTDMQVMGAGEVIDITKLHPENEVIQVLDSSASRTFLEKDNNLETILFRIGEIIEEQYSDKQSLITVSSKYMRDKVKQFFVDNMEEFPSPKTIALMSKGVNTYKDYDVQFLLAGRYSTGKEYAEDIYKYKAVENYFRIKRGLKPFNNLHPRNLTHKSSLPIEEDTVKRIEKVGNVGGLFEYKQFKLYPPSFSYPLLCYNYNAGETQQACRIRPDEVKPRKTYVLLNTNLPGMLVTKSILLSDFLNNDH